MAGIRPQTKWPEEKKKEVLPVAETKQNLQETAVIAKLFNLTERRVQQLAKEGILPVASKRPYKFDLLPTIQAYIRYLNDRLASKDKGEEYSTAEYDKLRAEANIKQSKDKIAEMQLKELEGKMHRSEDVEAVMEDLVYTIRGMILALPGRLAMDVTQAASAAEASAIIREECNKILNELAGYKYDPEEYQRRVKDRQGFSALSDEEDE